MVSILMTGCTSTPNYITKENNKIQMPNYSFVVPANKGWYIHQFEKQYEAVVITNEINPFIFQIKIMRNLILDEKKRMKTAKEIADEYRNLERQIMITQGVSRGMYQLKNLTMGEEKIRDKIFYTMSYTTQTQYGMQRAALYLYFPSVERKEGFILAHYSETIPSKAFLKKSFKPDFIRILESLSVNE